MEKSKKRRSVSKQRRKTVKSSKGASSVHTHTDWDDMDTDLEATLNDVIDYTLTQDEGKTEQQSTVKPDEGTDKQNEGTDKTKVSTDSLVEGTVKLKDQVSGESDTPTVPTMTSIPTPTVFGDDETIAQVLVTMSQNKSIQKLKAKVNEVERKFAQLANDEEISRMVQEEWEAEEEKKKLAEVEATKATLIRDYDDIQARIKADSILAARLQEEDREMFTIEERAKLLHDIIAAQRRFLTQQRATEIRSRPPTRTQLRNQMMTYLKHVGGKKHSDLKTKNFEEIQVLYEKVKRSDENFIAIGFAEDERLIKDVNKKATGTKKDESIKEESKEEESTRKRKLGIRKKMKSRKRRFRQDTFEDDEKENDELRLCLTIASDEDKEFVETKGLEEINLNVVIRSNGQRRYFSTLMRVLSIFDREDLNVVYQLVMDRYQDEIPKGFDKVLWGDLMIMFNLSDQDEFWSLQQDWNVVSWKLHGSLGVHTLMTKAGLVIHMLVEKKYPLRKKVLLQMLELKLKSEEDSTMALELIRFVKKLVAELEPEDSDGNEEDL
ncbi:hypothetical protein Tco_1410641 [Tanacetum coccineum]